MNNYDIKAEAMEFEAQKHNLKRLSFINKIYLTILVSIIFIIYTLEKVFTIHFEYPFSGSWFQYSILLVVYSFYVFLLDIKKMKEVKSTMAKYLVHFYIAFSLSATILFSNINHTAYMPNFFYTLVLISTVPFLVMKSKEIAITLSISSLLWGIGLGIQSGFNAIYSIQGIYVLTLSAIAFFISRTAYNNYLASLELRTQTAEEIQRLSNLTELLKEANRQLEQDATLDPLTNLYNRRAYNDYLIELQQRILVTPQSVSVIMVDVDCFKLFNDTYGHSKGDHVLSKIGRLLHDISAEYKCFAARWGGEEFVLILPNATEEVVERICLQIKASVHELDIEHESSTINRVVTVSMGACTKFITELNEIYECISEADAALYSVKENGRNSFEYRHQIHA
ncbi:GGDEF domain-containing protein [Ureibacillus chungkukjangi]|uniref:Diguanylate cyclase (GGDEF)-like protein n=1 Tax=Ureibacillus chungkukjangi TaxID=1202712 RepID=A0A318TZZ0_9BACL|nr:diguanylate cyclase [Ureibacillus chungkukjangi]PYF05219.1 diguanylate cyclase (GGDEF)-like protein [Ureibacillus chungkukjangi]